MRPPLLLVVLAGSLALSWFTVWLSIRVSHRVQALDRPDGDRKMQLTPIPRLGGVAVAVAFTVTSFLASGVIAPGLTPQVAGIVLPALVVAFLGFKDDMQSVNPWIRLLIQAGAASGAWIFGTRLSLAGIGWIDFLIFVLWVLVIVNGVNLLDNSDGLAASTALIAGIGSSLIAFVSGQEVVTVLAVALVGVAIGFLRHNWYPARVYLGDAGAYFLGMLLALLTVRLRPEQMPAVAAALVAVLLMILPLVDTFFVVIRRAWMGRHPFTAGRDHLSHSLQSRGANTPTSVLLLQTLSLAGMLSAVLLVVLLG